ncbi:hypothetical protein COO91_07700 [Nostoc flagelliforme CCNUN1]|uniref:Uncharacterized protein n=1 Tax=Nostoc flagelliforme CCNUN1 TaxID=2038116 RepID=A0A2K8T1R2_9NOSO|nr:hypothetical protein COO91_07700 [Nostoc flagelliforme CCNUN1]
MLDLKPLTSTLFSVTLQKRSLRGSVEVLAVEAEISRS